MAEQNLADRTERATPRRIEEARKRGQVPRSPELGAAAVMLAGAGALYLAGNVLAERMAMLMRETLSLRGVVRMDEGSMLTALSLAMRDALWSLAPLLGALLLAAVLAPLAIGGWNFSSEALGFKFERLNPASGLRRIFSVRGWVELGKSIAKFMVVACIAVIVLWGRSDDFAALAQLPMARAVVLAAQLCAEALLALAAGLVLIALIDVPFQLWQYQRDLRMTRDEVREELRDSDGSPEVKGRIRRAQQALARRRMMQAVPTASVVITNPQHYAVALRYDEERMRAPVVVAKGADEIARRIREIAADNQVPLVEAPPLARVLYRSVELDAEIPAVLYAAVAQVLSYVYQLKAAANARTQSPRPPQIDPQVEDLLPRPGDNR